MGTLFPHIRLVNGAAPNGDTHNAPFMKLPMSSYFKQGYTVTLPAHGNYSSPQSMVDAMNNSIFSFNYKGRLAGVNPIFK